MFFPVFYSPFLGLTSFGLYFIGSLLPYCFFLECFEGGVDLLTFQKSEISLVFDLFDFFSHFVLYRK